MAAAHVAAGRRQDRGRTGAGGALWSIWGWLGTSLTNVTRIAQVAHHGDTIFDECYAESTLYEDVKLRARNVWDASGDSLVL